MDTVAPESVGMCGHRLARVGNHLRGAYIDPGKIAGSQTLIARRGRVCYFESEGLMDRERALP